jgi:hypothetical protein
MTTSSSITAPAEAETFVGNWCDPRAQAVVASHDPTATITVTRAAGIGGVA